MRKVQLQLIQNRFSEYADKIKEIEFNFKNEMNKIPVDLPSYAYISRLQIASDHMAHRKEEELNKLYKDLSLIKLNYTFKDILFFLLIGSAIIIEIILLVIRLTN